MGMQEIVACTKKDEKPEIVGEQKGVVGMVKRKKMRGLKEGQVADTIAAG